MSVRAKFTCRQKEGGVVSLFAVYDGSEENKAFFNATPNGQINLYTVNERAAEQFEVGKSYYVDFSPAD